MSQKNLNQSQMGSVLTRQNKLRLPVYSGGANLPVGTIMIPGADTYHFSSAIVGGTDAGASGKGIIGLLAEPHIYSSPSASASGDATTNMTITTANNWFPGFATKDINCPSHNIDLLDTVNLLRMSYDLTSTAFTVTTATSTTIIANGSAEIALDGGFIYFSAGTALGELAGIKTSAANTSVIIYAALTTAFVAADTMIRIYPLFYKTPLFKANTTTAPQLIGTQAAAGSGAAVVLGNFISINGTESILDPVAFHNYQKLDKVNVLDFQSLLGCYNSVFHYNA